MAERYVSDEERKGEHAKEGLPAWYGQEAPPLLVVSMCPMQHGESASLCESIVCVEAGDCRSPVHATPRAAGLERPTVYRKPAPVWTADDKAMGVVALLAFASGGVVGFCFALAIAAAQ